MSNIATRPRTKVRRKTQRPRLHKVILINDDYTPREFVVTVLKAEFRMNEDQAFRVMITAHRRGACVVAVFTKDVAETKASEQPTQAAARAIRCCSRPSRRNSAVRRAPSTRCRPRRTRWIEWPQLTASSSAADRCWEVSAPRWWRRSPKNARCRYGRRTAAHCSRAATSKAQSPRSRRRSRP